MLPSADVLTLFLLFFCWLAHSLRVQGGDCGSLQAPTGMIVWGCGMLSHRSSGAPSGVL